MDKKLIIGAILAVFIIISVSMGSAVNTVQVTQKSVEKKLDKLDSPLFKMRSRDAIIDKNQQSKEKIYYFIEKYFENRIFSITPIINLFIKKIFGVQESIPEQNYRIMDTYSKCTYTADSARCKAAGMSCYTSSC